MYPDNAGNQEETRRLATLRKSLLAPLAELDLLADRRYTPGIMKTFLQSGAPLLAILAASYSAPCVRAEPPAATPTTGHVLVLENDRTLDGSIERIGDQYRIRRNSGETWLPAEPGSRLCESYEDAYQLLRRRSNLDDADEHARLAQWCQQHDLKTQAVAEARIVVAIRPDSPDGKRLLAMLERWSLQSTVTGTPAPAGVHESASTLPAVDVEPDSLTEFITHIQPILMNACASCHGAQHAGAFKLIRVTSEGVLSRKHTLQNLSAVMCQVNLQSPELSPVLTKAKLAHGDQTQPPLNTKGQQAIALQTLQDWIKETLGKNPLLPQQLGGSALLADARPSLVQIKSSGEALASEPSPQKFVGPPKDLTPEVQPPPAPAQPADEFDGTIFNRQFHPGKK